MEIELHLPWDNDSLQVLLRKIIQTGGETTKVDFKRQLNITTGEHHAELLKDISALANTYDYSYKNHGFIILGVSDNKLTHTKFDQNADGLQARIDELLKNYIEPFIPTQVRIFGSGEEIWGVIIIPPTRTAPHVFVKEICKRCRGDIFVRRGTTTDKATPSDYPNQYWFDAVGSVIEAILQRILNFDDPIWNRKEAYFIGEFILCLTPLDVVDRDTKMPSIGHPSSGLYLYMSEANPLLKRFLRNESKAIAQLFKRPLSDILTAFHKSAARLVQGHWADGFAGGALKEAFPELASQQETPKK